MSEAMGSGAPSAFVVQEMAHEEVVELFTHKGSFYHRFFIDFLRYGKALRRFFQSSDYLKSNFTVLDAGCGTGVLTRVLFDLAGERRLEGVRFHGFDLTPAMLDLFGQWISRRGAESIELTKADVLMLAEDLPPSWRDFDLIVTSAMLEYVPKSQLGQALRNLAGLLADDGTLLLFISRRNVIMRLLIQAWWKANVYRRDQIRQILLGAGFGSVRFLRFPFPYTFVNVWGHVIEAKK